MMIGKGMHCWYKSMVLVCAACGNGRMTVATEMLGQGGNLTEIARVLRQSDSGTTYGYANVDRVAVRAVARAWPGAVG